MSKKTSGDRAAKIAKAGKRSGMVNYPAPAGSEKLAAHEAGEQQFIAKAQQYIERTVIKYDEKKMRFVNRVVQTPVDYTFDPTRGRMVQSPVTQKIGIKEKKGQ